VKAGTGATGSDCRCK